MSDEEAEHAAGAEMLAWAERDPEGAADFIGSLPPKAAAQALAAQERALQMLEKHFAFKQDESERLAAEVERLRVLEQRASDDVLKAIERGAPEDEFKVLQRRADAADAAYQAAFDEFMRPWDD